MTKRERMTETVNQLMNELPITMQMAVKAFCPSFLQLLNDVPEAEIDRFIHMIKEKIDFIEGEAVSDAEVQE